MIALASLTHGQPMGHPLLSPTTCKRPHIYIQFIWLWDGQLRERLTQAIMAIDSIMVVEQEKATPLNRDTIATSVPTMPPLDIAEVHIIWCSTWIT